MNPTLKVLEQIPLLRPWEAVSHSRLIPERKYCAECGAKLRWLTAKTMAGVEIYHPTTGQPFVYQYYSCPRTVRVAPRWKFWVRATRPCWWSGDIRRREKQ